MVEQTTETKQVEKPEEPEPSKEELELEAKQRQERERRMDKTMDLLEPQTNRYARAITGEHDDAETANSRIPSGDTLRLMDLLKLSDALGLPHAKLWLHDINIEMRALSPELQDFGQRGEVITALTKQETKKKPELEAPAQARTQSTQTTGEEA